MTDDKRVGLSTLSHSTGRKGMLFMVGYMVVTVALWLTSDWIKPAPSTLMFLGVLSCICVYVVKTHWKGLVLQQYKKARMQCLIIGICLFAAFASFGYRLFLTGNYVTVSANRIMYYVLGVIWFYPICTMILMALEAIGKHVIGKTIEHNVSPCKVGLFSWLIALSCLTIAYIGFYPGSFANDTINQLTQIYDGSYSNWHPVVHTWIIEFLISIGGSPSAAVYLQLVVFAALIGRISLIPYSYGVKPKYIFVGVAFFALLPNQAVTNISLLKDFMFTYALVWGTILLFELGRATDKRKTIMLYVELILCMYLMKELRHNGIVPLVFTIATLIIITVKKWGIIKLKAIICIVVAGIMIVLTEGPIFSVMNVASNPISSFVTMFCGVGSCLNKDKDLSDDTMLRLQDVMSIQNWREYYGRFVGHDNYLWGGGENRMDLSSFSAQEAFEIYFEALQRYPDVVIKDRLDGMNIMWDVTQPDDEGNFNFRVFDTVCVYDEYGLSKEGLGKWEYFSVESPIADFYRKWIYAAFPGERAEDQVSDMLLWRSGAYLIFFLILAVYWTKNKLYRMWWAAMPMLGNIAAMLLVLYHQSFRYVYFIQLCVLTLTLMTFLMQRKQQENTNNAVFENV